MPDPFDTLPVLPTGPGLDSATAPAVRLVAALGREVGEQAAAVWVHATAVAHHAAAHRLTGPVNADPRLAVEQLAAAHPVLTRFGTAALAVMDAHPLTPQQQAEIGQLWQQHGQAVRDDPRGWPDGYRIGDLYQALSTPARKGRALCQTPRFVTELLFKLGLYPAIEEFGLDGFKMADPAAGCGHILIEALLATGMHVDSRHRGGLRAGDLLYRAAAEAVTGVEIDAYAAAVAGYRLAALAATALRAGSDLPDSTAPVLRELPDDWPVNIAVADALLDCDAPQLARGQYHAVIANPPYIVIRDKATNDAVRKAWPQVCSGKYSMALPFHALMCALAVPGGFIAQLTANSFMKREFGKKYVETFLSGTDLTWVIDTSGAYIPGHGTPTVILVNRNRPPSGPTVRTIRGVRGEPRLPEDPARGVVWSAIASKVDEYLSWDRFTAAAQAAGYTVTAYQRT